MCVMDEQRSGSDAGSSSSTRSGWAEMEPNVLIKIFQRLSFGQLYSCIPHVCKSWKLVSLDPVCWKTLDLHHYCFLDYGILQIFVQRSQGLLQELTLLGIQSPPFLYFLAGSAPLLRKLHIPNSCADDDWATYAAPLMPNLIDLDISMCGGNLSSVAIQSFGKNCGQITTLRINSVFEGRIPAPDDEEVLTIAENYPRLKHLELQMNRLSTWGLRALMDNCPSLEYLDLTGCPHLEDMDETLTNECETRLHTYIEPWSELFGAYQGWRL